MLIHGKLLKLFIRSAEDVSIITGKIYYWDNAKLTLGRNRVTLIRSCAIGAILGGLQLISLILNVKSDKNMSSETIFGIFFPICFLWNIHYLFSMAFIGIELQTFINSAYRFEQAHANEMQIALNKKSNRRILKLTRFYQFLMHYGGTRLTTFLLAFLSAVAPTLPLNLLSFPPGSKLRMGMMGATNCVENSTYAALKTYRQVQILVGNLNRAHSTLLVSLLVIILTTLVLFNVSMLKSLTTGNFTAPGNLYINCFFADSTFHVIIILLSVYGLCGSVHHEAKETTGEGERGEGKGESGASEDERVLAFIVFLGIKLQLYFTTFLT
ncbi:unnamed protein product [Orchesella dallaii]|uniref:Gustatory receptor n=1 Tax=Orchesella dallaii TaxID=48710 RepID=A0ABP1RVE2_9HEXA